MKQRCESCPTKLDCVSAFGIYWDEKSGGGVGCEHPFAYCRRDAAAHELKRTAAGQPQKGLEWR